MKSVAAIFSLLCLIFTVPQTIHARPPRTTGIIQQTCALTDYKDLCITALTSDPNSFQADKTGLALIALRLASSNASDISEGIKVLFNDSSLADPSVQQGLFDCLDQYLDASQQLDDSIAALLANAYKDVETWVKVAIANAQTCGASFGVQPSVLSQKNEVFTKLCNIALAIAKLAASGH